MYFLNAKDKFTLTSSTAFVEDYPAWDSSTTYNTDEMVIYNNRIYKSLIDDNSDEPGNSVNWFDEGATNPYKCVDEYVNTQTINPDNLEMWFDIKVSNSLALINCEFTSGTIEIYDSDDNVVFTQKISGVTGINSFGDYFFGDIEFVNKIFVKFAYMFVGKVKIYLEHTANVKVGVIQIGYLQDLGLTLQEVSASIDDYSKKSADENGNTIIVEGNYADRTECKVLLKNITFNDAKRRLAAIRATPCVYIASEDDIYRELNLYGIYESFNIDIDNANYFTCSLTLRGLI